MNRDEIQHAAFRHIAAAAPELAASAVEQIINSGPFQRWMARIERERPRGIVALVRRLRGKRRGVSAEEMARAERILDEAIKAARRK